MKFTKNAEANMSHFQGAINTAFEDLVAVFGEPDFGPDGDPDDKVTCEWAIKFEDGTVATIYDWKIYGPTPKGTYNWHIGGYDQKAVYRVMQALRPQD